MGKKTKTQYVDCRITKGQLKTKFTHCLNGELGWVESINQPSDFFVVKYVGECKTNGDIFVVHSENGRISFYKGVKGDEFN